jgi:Arc-like DNA binding domain
MTTQPSIHVRLPATLLAALRHRAEDEGMSLNALILALLAGSIGFQLDSPETASVAKRAAHVAKGRPRAKASGGTP